MFATPGPLDFVAVAPATLQFWERERVFSRLVAKNRGGRRFSFLDGPITANNPMGSTTRGDAPSRTSSSVTERCAATTSDSRTASIARGCGWRSRSRRPWGSTRSGRSSRSAWSASLAPAANGCCASPRSRPSSRSSWASGWTGPTPTSRCRTPTPSTTGPSSSGATSVAGSTRGIARCRGARAAAPRSRSTRCWTPTPSSPTSR